MNKNLIAAFVLAGISLAIAGCDTTTAAPWPVSDTRAAVRVAEVRSAAPETWYRFPGVVRAADRAEPAFLQAGTLAERMVTRGQRVARGEPLARLHNPSLEPALAVAQGQVAESEARIGQLRRDLERARDLRRRDLVAAAEVDRLEAELEAAIQAREQAMARRNEAEAQVGEMLLRAPFNGWVSDVYVEPGDFIGAGQAVLALVGVQGLEIEIRLPSSIVPRLETGLSVEIVPALRSGRYTGQVASAGRAGDALAPIIIGVSETQGLSAGEPVNVHLPLPDTASLQIPLAAIVDPGGHAPHVLALDEGDGVHKVQITPGRLAGDWVGVESDLATGVRVVIAGQGRLVEGDRVRVLP